MTLEPKGNHCFVHAGRRRWLRRMVAMWVVLIAGTAVYAEDDPIYEQCRSQTDRPGPWCYQEEVETIGDPDHLYARRLTDVGTITIKDPPPSLHLIGVA